jgi:hypothetical protein
MPNRTVTWMPPSAGRTVNVTGIVIAAVPSPFVSVEV